jgi:hypothetical protein
MDAGKFPRARVPVPSHNMKTLLAKVYKSYMLLHLLVRYLKHGTSFCFVLNDQRKLKIYFMFSGGEG